MAPLSPLLGLPSITADLERVEVALREAVRADDAYLTQVASHLIDAGGKRGRPLFAVAAAGIRQPTLAPSTDDVIAGAVAVELVHLGSLYHDDVMDDASTRRTVESVNARWGNLQAILAGDYLLSRASEIAASLGTEVAGLLARTIARLCEGQILELQHTYDIARDEQVYLRAIDGKTAALYGTACRIGALTADLDRDDVERLTTFGRLFGMAFQIVDDVLDIVASDEQLGKPAGHDMVEGVYTLPVIRVLARGDAKADELRSMLGKPLDDDEMVRARDLMRADDATPEALDVAARYLDEARDALDHVGDTEAATGLRGAADHLLASARSITVGNHA